MEDKMPKYEVEFSNTVYGVVVLEAEGDADVSEAADQYLEDNEYEVEVGSEDGWEMLSYNEVEVDTRDDEEAVSDGS
jgi:hypothetical protein